MPKLEQYTTVYSEEYGKGYILNIKYRRGNNLLMCSFPKENETVFISERQLLTGQHDVTLEPVTPQVREELTSELEQALRNLFGGG